MFPTTITTRDSMMEQSAITFELAGFVVLLKLAQKVFVIKNEPTQMNMQFHE